MLDKNDKKIRKLLKNADKNKKSLIRQKIVG